MTKFVAYPAPILTSVSPLKWSLIGGLIKRTCASDDHRLENPQQKQMICPTQTLPVGFGPYHQALRPRNPSGLGPWEAEASSVWAGNGQTSTYMRRPSGRSQQKIGDMSHYMEEQLPMAILPPAAGKNPLKKNMICPTKRKKELPMAIWLQGTFAQPAAQARAALAAPP